MVFGDVIGSLTNVLVMLVEKMTGLVLNNKADGSWSGITASAAVTKNTKSHIEKILTRGLTIR